MRDLFGSMLFFSLKQRIDMGEVLKYPPTQIPLFLANVDGSMQQTQSKAIAGTRVTCCICSASASIDAMIIDAMFFLHLLVGPPSTFASIARYILGRICSATSREVNFVFDK